jgi:hypothetical protein
MSMKNSSDTIGNRSNDLSGCRTVPQPTALPRLKQSKLTIISNPFTDTLAANPIPRYLLIYSYMQQDATSHSLFYLETALHVSDGTSTHHQERKHLYLQHLVFVTPLLLPAAIVEELELGWVCCGLRMPPTTHPTQFQRFHDSGR